LIQARIFGFSFKIGKFEISEENGIDKDWLLNIFEVLANEGRNDLTRHQLHIFSVDESIRENAMALISPQSEELVLGFDAIDRGLVEAFVNARKISQIENVVEFEGSTGQALAALEVKLQGGLRDRTDTALDVLGELIQVMAQQRRVNRLN